MVQFDQLLSLNRRVEFHRVEPVLPEKCAGTWGVAVDPNNKSTLPAMMPLDSIQPDADQPAPSGRGKVKGKVRKSGKRRR